MNKQSPRTIIAFTGPMGCGKSVAADYLVNTYDFVKVNFKDALIKEVKRYMGTTLTKIARDHECRVSELFTKKPYKPVVREILKDYGMMRRADDKDYWVKRWWNIAREQEKIVIDDLRFLNEFQWAKIVHAQVIKLDRHEAELEFEKATHPSELEMKKFTADTSISNNGKREALYKSLDDIINN